MSTLLAVALVSILFRNMIRGYIEALVLAAVFGAMIRPIYLGILPRVVHRESIASGLTLLCAIVVFIFPAILFLDALASEAQEIAADLAPRAESSRVTSLQPASY